MLRCLDRAVRQPVTDRIPRIAAIERFRRLIEFPVALATEDVDVVVSVSRRADGIDGGEICREIIPAERRCESLPATK